jgi:hypothetical protein
VGVRGAGVRPQIAGAFEKQSMELEEVVTDIARGLFALDAAGSRFREFRPGAGPFGEPQLVKHLAAYLNTLRTYREPVQTERFPIY